MTLVFPRAPGFPTYDVLLGYTADYYSTQRELSHVYISENPVELALTPHVKSRTASGGVTTSAAAARPAQTMRLIEGSSVIVTDPSKTELGWMRSRTWQLMADWNAVLTVNDTFIFDGKPWKVLSMMAWNGYERRATVERVGD